jgi:hypothetical protein
MTLFEELIEDKELDKKIVKTFKMKNFLCQDIFNGTSINEDVKKSLIKISDNFIDSLGIEFFIHDIVLTGSLANYNWSEYSDVDLHILIDFKETDYNLDMLKEFFDAKKDNWNEQHNITIKGFDVEIYVQDVNEEHVSSGVYSILHDKWIVKPNRKNPNIDDDKILNKSEELAKKIDGLYNKSEEGKDMSKDLDRLRKKIKKFRQTGLSDGGEFSYENLTFKLLRRNGYIGKLLKLKNKIIDNKLSIT